MLRLLLHVSLAFLASPMSNLVAQDANPSIGQTKMKELAFLIGEWQYSQEDGATGKQSITWINNKSFIQMKHGDVIDIVGWDLEENRFATWTFGGLGGHGKAFWTKKNDSWFCECKPYYVNDGTPVTSEISITPLNDDTMHWTGHFANEKFDLKLTRVRAD